MRRRVNTAYQLRHAKRSRIVAFLKIFLSLVIVVGFAGASIYGFKAYQNAQVRSQSLSEVINGLRMSIPQKYPGVYEKPFDTKADAQPSYPAHSSLTSYLVVPDMQEDTTVFFWPKDSTVADLEAKGTFSGKVYSDAVSRDKLMLEPVGQGVESYMRDHGFAKDTSVSKTAAQVDQADHWQLYRRSDETCSVKQNSKGVTVSCQTQTLVDRVAILSKPLVTAYTKAVPQASTANLLVGQADFGSSKTPGYTYAYMSIGETTGGLNGTGVFYSHNSYWHFVAITLEGLSCNTIAANPDAKIALADQCDPSGQH